MAEPTALDEWTVSSNTATPISLVRPQAQKPSLETVHQFHPDFTYPIFGQDEVIFGYKHLKIRTRFAAHNLRPNIEITYDEKFKQLGDAQATDIIAKLKQHLPDSAFERGFDKKILADQDARGWKPPGKLHSTYSRKGGKFEIWAGSLLDSQIRAMVTDIQIMVLFFIEGGQTLPLDEEPDWSLERWKVYFVYEVTQVADASNLSPYVLCGYATTYRFHKFVGTQSRPGTSGISSMDKLEKIDHLRQPCRVRISQYIILPPYQHAGHGSTLYKTIYDEVLADPAVVEMTVEDPSEEFDRLRDVCDFRTLEPKFKAADIKLNINLYQNKARLDVVPIREMLPHSKLDQIRLASKIIPRQFSRMVEMYLYSNIPLQHRDPIGANTNTNTRLMVRKHRTENVHDRTYYWWRMLMRYRIFKQNEDVLKALASDEERLNITTDTSRGQQDEYEGMLFKMAEAAARAEPSNDELSLRNNKSAGHKRKLVIDDDDDDEGADSSSSAPKRPRE